MSAGSASAAPAGADGGAAAAGWWSAWLSLLASGGTLVCCALPALLVSLGLGAALAGLVSAVPALVWVSEYKAPVFGVAALLLAGAGALQWHLRTAPCPVDPALRQACLRTRRWSRWVWTAAVGLFALQPIYALLFVKSYDSFKRSWKKLKFNFLRLFQRDIYSEFNREKKDLQKKIIEMVDKLGEEVVENFKDNRVLKREEVQLSESQLFIFDEEDKSN